MITAVKEGLNNENGFVLVLAVLMLAVITVIGVAATRTSDTETQIASNQRQIADEFYDAEGALIEALDVEFKRGLNIITGETGAGKSILIGALKMILGERAIPHATEHDGLPMAALRYTTGKNGLKCSRRSEHVGP